MTIGLTKGVAVTPMQNDIEKLVGEKGTTLADEKKRLRFATKEFESMFMYQMLKTMRETIPTDDKSGALFSGGYGKEMFTDMFDMELSKKMAGGDRSISEMLYKKMEQVLDAQYEVNREAIDLKPLQRPDQEAIPLQKNPLDLIPKQILKLKTEPAIKPLEKPAPKEMNDLITAKFGEIIEDASKQTGLDTSLIRAVIKMESGGNPDAVSPAGAGGLMQLMDSTATELGVTDRFDPEQNVLFGSKYLAKMLDRFGDLKLALAAYNAGPGTVERYGSVPPYKETEQYVEKVIQEFTSHSEQSGIALKRSGNVTDKDNE